MTDEESPIKEKLLNPLILFLSALALRIPFTSRMLYHHDSVNFALALDHYDLRLHQPHPPGYLLYVILGRFLHLFISDANTVLVTISIVFTSLTVVVIYFLAKEMYGLRTGYVASFLALSSPNLWFHGEVALSYGVEAFFSALAAYLCWGLRKGRGEWLLLSAVVLAIAGGFRQNTCLFLLPLWFYCACRFPARQVVAALAVIAASCAVWLVATVGMTGGIGPYREAFAGLWNSNTGHNSVFEKGWPNGVLFGKTILLFCLYSLGAGIAAIGTGLYGYLRSGRLTGRSSGDIAFYAAWMLPSYLFYQFIFIHPANPGYLLILAPPLLLLTARGVVVTAEILAPSRLRCAGIITAVLVAANAALFLLSESPVSWGIIKRHDRDLATVLAPCATVIPPLPPLSSSRASSTASG